jgi:hypothetical protein
MTRSASARIFTALESRSRMSSITSSTVAGLQGADKLAANYLGFAQLASIRL